MGIISKAEDGWSIRQLALHYNISKNSVFNILKKWRQHGRIDRNPGAGRKKISNLEQDGLLIQTIREHPFYTVVNAVRESNFPGSSRTARRRIKETDLRCRSAAKKILLTQNHKDRRVGFALEYVAVDDNFWNNIIFTDEKTFQSTRNGPIRVYRPPNSRFEEEYVNHAAGNRFGVNMWAWISALGPGVLWHIDGTLNSETYITILNDIMLPSVSLLYPNNRQFVFQQDNCPVHTANVVQDWFMQNNVRTLNWPSRSPDLNPMENVWGLLVKKLQSQNHRLQSAEELLQVLQNAWETIEDDYCFNLCHSMPRRLAEVINRNGAMTKY